MICKRFDSFIADIDLFLDKSSLIAIYFVV